MVGPHERLTIRLLAAAACGGLRPNRPHCREGMGADMLLGGERSLGLGWLGPVRRPLNVNRQVPTGSGMEADRILKRLCVYIPDVYIGT